MPRLRLVPAAAAVAAALGGAGCAGYLRDMRAPPTPVKAGIAPADLVDPGAEDGARVLTDAVSLYQVAERVKAEHRPAVLPPKKTVLCLSGGGAYGAYTAGVLLGWTAAGTRPQFDTVTGISTGALIAPLAFLGPGYDGEVRRMYTEVRKEDLFRLKKTLRSVFSEALADNAPLVDQLEKSATPQLVAAVAAEHARGRRLYVGTTDLDGRRQVVWDMGAIASRGRPEDVALFRQVILASASIPGFFPPVRIPVSVDGKVYEERHVDGGVNATVFFRPPYTPPGPAGEPAAISLYNTDLYVVVAGKIYADAEPVSPRALKITATGVSALLYAQGRGDLFSLYTASALTGMNYHVAAVPGPVRIKGASTDFDPDDMATLFRAGLEEWRKGTVWRTTPPGLEPGEGVSQRAGVVLTRVPRTNQQPLPGPRAEPDDGPVPGSGNGFPGGPGSLGK